VRIDRLVANLRADEEFMQRVSAWHTISAQSASFAPFPEELHPALHKALLAIGVSALYSHQRLAWDAVFQGKNIVVSTPTASGKSMAYLLPVLDALLRKPGTRALLLFPTKALSQDQQALLQKLNEIAGLGLQAFTYDGDTAPAARKAVRMSGQLVITNPDMLHSGILPNHTAWVKLFENLDFVVIDELHHYRGVFGSHVANVIARLLRIRSFYTNRPLRFLLSSATIANPLEHAAKLTSQGEESFVLIHQSGAPQGKKHIILYNPPVIQQELGIRRSSLKEAAAMGRKFIDAGISSIFFLRSRVRVEVLTEYLRRRARSRRQGVFAYRGGYLPGERRQIEQGLREGRIHTVVSTNALELGVDIGSLDIAVSIGYPGSAASLWQQFGRAGRSDRTSVAIFIATSDPLDQYYMNEPKALLEKQVERALVYPENLLIQMAHLKCSAFEIPLRAQESLGSYPVAEMAEYLKEAGVLKRENDRYYWMSDLFPANEISLRSASNENFVITEKQQGVIGEVDFYAAPTLLHEKAIYLHQGHSYTVEKLDWEKRQAFVVKSRPDYFTDAEEKISVQILDASETISLTGNWEIFRGEIALHRQAVLYKKIRLYTHENIGWGKIALPEIQMHTQAFWMVFAEPFWLPEESIESRGQLVQGVAYLLGHLAPLFVMCDRTDLNARGFVKAPFSEQSAILFYDSYPGGIALSHRLFHLIQNLLDAGVRQVQDCRCNLGCPSCIGPGFSEAVVKKGVISVLDRLIQTKPVLALEAQATGLFEL